MIEQGHTYDAAAESGSEEGTDKLELDRIINMHPRTPSPCSDTGFLSLLTFFAK